MNFKEDDLAMLTMEYGGDWGINHTKRLLKIISEIGEGILYNYEAIMISVYLHDWGAYKKWAVPGVDHAVRSRQVAEEFLKTGECDKDLVNLILECIEFHHTASETNSVEALLLSDADALDFLGAVGVLRDFSKKPNDLRKAYETARNRRDKLPQRMFLKKSQEIAKERVKRMDMLLEDFEHETFGYF